MPSPSEVYHHRRYWQKSILIPLWTQQFLLQVIGVVGFWAAITIYWSGGPSHGPSKKGDKKEQAILGVFFILYLTLTLATLGEMLLYCAHALQPKGYLLSQVLKFVASVGVWATLVLWPYVIKDPLAPRLQATVGMEAIFAWLQIPMLSSLVHALLVWREEWVIKKEIREHSAQLEAAANHYSPPSMTSNTMSQRQFTNERTPLLSPHRIIGGRGRAGSVA